MYKLLANILPNGSFGEPQFVRRLSDNADIPLYGDSSTGALKQYLDWIAEGNTPEPADQGE